MDPSEIPFNKWDEKKKMNRISYQALRKRVDKQMEIVDNRPRNPIGRTGVEGRGVLGTWGPNHAVDPIVTRFKKTHGSDQRKILEWIAVQRSETGEWSIPGGMIRSGESEMTENETVKITTNCLIRIIKSKIFSEDDQDVNPELEKKLKQFFDYDESAIIYQVIKIRIQT